MAVLIILLLGASTVSALDGLYVGGGVGTASGRLALGLNATYKFQSYTVSARGSFSESNDKSTTWFTDHTEEFALMVGWSSAHAPGKLTATVEGGIGTISISEVKYSIRHTIFGDVLSADDKLSFTELGLAVQSQIYAGRVGLVLFGNFNRQEEQIGVLACFRFGRVN